MLSRVLDFVYYLPVRDVVLDLTMAGLCVKITQARIGCRQDGSLVAQARIDWHRGYIVLALLERGRETCSLRASLNCPGQKWLAQWCTQSGIA